ncbi:MAG: thermosome subunit, partial [Candidatus Hecatellales archaeon]
MAAKIIGEVLRSTLGPRGMDKMLVDSLGDVTVTNDGATILKEIDVQHPAAKMLVEAAKTQDNAVGDGTTTVVVLASELLRKAEELLDQNIHPTLVVSGYRKAAQQALEELNSIAREVNREDEEVLRKVASTAVRSKAIAAAREKILDMAIKAVKTIAEKRGEKWVADVDLIQITKKAGGSFTDTRLINGLIIDKEVVHSGMPRRVDNAKIALLECPLEIEKTEISAEIRIRDPTQMKA